MAFKFSSVGHVFATVAHDIVTGARAVEGALSKAAATEATVEALTQLVDPGAVPIERAAYFCLGKITSAVHDAGPAVSAGGLSITLDEAELKDVQDLVAYLKAHPFTKQALASSSIPAKV